MENRPVLWPHSFRKPPAQVVGYIEQVDPGLIRGWAWNPSEPTGRLRLDVFIGGVYAGCARTGHFREDLKENDVGDGRHAFVFHIPVPLRGPAVSLDDVEIITINTPTRRLGKVNADGIVTDIGPWSGELTPATYFKPLVESLNATIAACSDTEPAARRQVDCLLASSKPERPSDFAIHIARKYGRPEPAIDDRRFWAWYLGSYGLEKGEARAPLSTSDLEALRAMRQAGRQAAAFLLPATYCAANIYHWAVDEARSLFVEDCLVTRSECARLSRPPLWHWRTRFPLSQFMRRFHSTRVLAEHFDGKTLESRLKIYALIMLFALQDVHYLSFMPRHWLSEMLTARGRDSHFERAQQELLGVAMKPNAYRQHVASLGFDVDTQSFCGTTYRQARVCHGSRVLAGSEQVDVQLIGPFKRSLGLAESCRRLAVGLHATGFSLNCCDFDIGRASASRETSLPINALRAARINILHVNAEEVPEAIAYLPDCFSQSHTILVPYWELNRPAAQHALGIALVDEIWAATRYLADVFADGEKPVTHVAMSVDDRPKPTRAEGRSFIQSLRIPSRPFIFLTTSDALSWPQRKNPIGVIDAFKAAFPSFDAALIVKTRHASTSLLASQKAYWQTVRARCEDDPRIFLIDKDLSNDEQRALLAGCDCLVSLHRAEGLGLDILDALASGTPVIATAYSGNMDYCDEQSAWLVDFDLADVGPNDYAFFEPGQVWAEPRLDSAVAALRSVLHDEEERMARARRASSRVQKERSLATFSARLAKEIERRLDEREALTQRHAPNVVA